MTLGQITLLFVFVLMVVAIAMFVHALIDRRRIARAFARAASGISGEILRDGLFSYPRLLGRIDGRRAEVFFRVYKVGRSHLLYLHQSVEAKPSATLFVVRNDFYRPISDEASFSREAGASVEGLSERFQIHSLEAETARRLFTEADLSARLEDLKEFATLQIGPDAIIAALPYEGEGTIASGRIHSMFLKLSDLARAAEGR